MDKIFDRKNVGSGSQYFIRIACATWLNQFIMYIFDATSVTPDQRDDGVHSAELLPLASTTKFRLHPHAP